MSCRGVEKLRERPYMKTTAAGVKALTMLKQYLEIVKALARMLAEVLCVVMREI